MRSKDNAKLLVSHLLFADDTFFFFFVRLTLIIFVIYATFSYALKLFQSSKLTWKNQN